MKYILFSFALIFLSACNNKPVVNNTNTHKDITETKKQVVVNFDENGAYDFIQKQVDFGPRVPGTKEHLACYNYLVEVLKPLADTMYFQNTFATTFDKKTIPVKNIIAAFNTPKETRIILCAHWDTRPFADQDTKDKDMPILGANDGGSGVGVLLQIAKNLSIQKPEIGIDIILFDSEDWGDATGGVEDSYCLGSQAWGKAPHIRGYKADFGILLDMVGAPNATFGNEGYSMQNANTALSIVWQAAASAGYDNYFRNFETNRITDDHYYVWKNTGIPTIDIIHHDQNSRNGFGEYWHTHNDNMNAIDKKTLKAVGQTLVNVIYNY